MTKATPVECVRKGLAEITGTLEDATLTAAEGQGVLDVSDARLTCDRLIAVLERCLARLKRLRRQIR